MRRSSKEGPCQEEAGWPLGKMIVVGVVVVLVVVLVLVLVVVVIVVVVAAVFWYNEDKK